MNGSLFVPALFDLGVDQHQQALRVERIVVHEIASGLGSTSKLCVLKARTARPTIVS